MPLLDNARLIARGVSLEVPRYFSERAWKRQFVNQLKSRQVDVVLDVGANSGQYAMGLRKRGYQGRLVSFEPLAGPFSDLQSNAAKDPLWECRRHHSAMSMGRSRSMSRATPVKAAPSCRC
ncbi:hypothetical protein MSTO_11800 [Mycobacterium stomatepiae]|uniref:FkbM family methyltransferase n=1 Tax=Mycobacterium stomatepiae TaxID=470076 RepID=A0A7I7Q3P3_9MYCO|nr:hypothetical protein MSTO_11800 [Mycobacterium stomatepiae]